MLFHQIMTFGSSSSATAPAVASNDGFLEKGAIVEPSRAEWKCHAHLQLGIRDRLTTRPESAPPPVTRPWIVQVDGGVRSDQHRHEHRVHHSLASDGQRVAEKEKRPFLVEPRSWERPLEWTLFVLCR